MKKVSVAFAAMALAMTITPAVFATSLTFDHDTGSITFNSDNPADQGTITVTDFAFIQNTSATKSLTIQGFEFYLGGTSVSGAAGDTPSTFIAANNKWTYSIGEGDLAPSAKGTGWSKNSTPTIGAAVRPTSATSLDYLNTVSVVNSSSSGYCYTGEVLAHGAECQVELMFNINYGGAMDSSSDTFVYGYADGRLSGSGAGAVSDSQFQGMEESVHIHVTPEPDSLVLLGTGFGLVGLVIFLKRCRTAAQVTIA